VGGTVSSLASWRSLGAIVSCALVLAGCGGSEGGSPGTAPARKPNQQVVNSKGTEASERTTALHLSRHDCDLLGAALTKRTGRTVYITSDPQPPLSGCRLNGHRIHVTITLDTSYGAHQRYLNRIVETQQFGAPDQAKMPHPVPGVGEPGAYGQSANWIPAIGTLLAVRGNRWLTISYGAEAETRPERKAGAVALALRAFRLSAR
jgi:hypothetical protein